MRNSAILSLAAAQNLGMDATKGAAGNGEAARARLLRRSPPYRDNMPHFADLSPEPCAAFGARIKNSLEIANRSGNHQDKNNWEERTWATERLTASGIGRRADRPRAGGVAPRPNRRRQAARAAARRQICANQVDETVEFLRLPGARVIANVRAGGFGRPLRGLSGVLSASRSRHRTTGWPTKVGADPA